MAVVVDLNAVKRTVKAEGGGNAVEELALRRAL
jgi:hypothetical protein